MNNLIDCITLILIVIWMYAEYRDYHEDNEAKAGKWIYVGIACGIICLFLTYVEIVNP